MAKSILDIVINTIKQGTGNTETVKALVSVKSAIMNTAGAAGILVGAGVAIDKALDATVGTLVAYADQVRRVQGATGLSAEESSKLIQVLDDQKTSYEQLEKAIQKSGKAYDFSIEGIAKMSDSYLQLETSQEQAAFMQERFGKQWISFVPIMQQGRDAILGAADAVSENLILTQQAVDAARQYEVGMDNLSDSVLGVKMSLGQALLPTVNEVVDGMNVWIRAIEIAKEKNDGGIVSQKEWKAALEEATAEVAYQKQGLSDHAQALDDDAISAEENAEAIRQVSAAHQSMLGLIGNIAGETQNYNDKQAELTVKMQENRAEMETLYPWQKQQIDELNQKYLDMENTYAANAEAHAAAMGKIQYDLFITKISVDGVTDAEFLMAQQAGLTFGVFDQKSVETAQNMDTVAQAVADGRIAVEDMKRALDLLPSLKSIDVVIDVLQRLTTVQQNVTNSGSANYVQQLGNSGYAGGGIARGPQSGHMELLHGDEAVIPLQNGSVPVQMVGNGNPTIAGGDNYYITLTVASPVTLLDQQQAQNVLLPYIVKGIRQAKAQGAIK